MPGISMPRLRLALPLLALAVVAVFPFLASDYLLDVTFFFGIYVLLGLSLNIVLGEVGLYDLGHAGFYAIGAYATAILNTKFGIPVLLLLPVAAIAAGLFAFLVTSPIIHLRGDYLCIVTIGMGEIVRLGLINNPLDLTGGPNGVYGIDSPTLGFLKLDSSMGSYYLIWVVVGPCRLCPVPPAAFAHRPGMELHPGGRGGGAGNRHQRPRAQAARLRARSSPGGSGWKPVRRQAHGGLAGELHVLGVLPHVQHCLIGGMGSVPGVIIGAAAISLFPEIFRSFANYRMVIFGVVMILMMMFRPGGAWPRRRGGTEAQDLLRRLWRSNG